MRLICPLFAVVLESRDGFAAISGHGKVNLAFLVVEIEVDSAVFLAFPVLVHHIVFFENLDEVICVLFSNIFYTEIINYEAECDWSLIVLPEAWCFVTLAVAIFRQPLFEELLGNDSCVGKPAHSAFHADVDIPIFVHFFA